MYEEVNELTQVTDDLIWETTEPEAKERAISWSNQVAISTLVMALLSAVAALLAGFMANEALLERTNEIMEVSNVQGALLEIEMLKSKHDLLIVLGQQPDLAEMERVRQNEEKIEELTVEIRREENWVLGATQAHQILAVALTFLSIGISLSGMSLIVKRKWLWGMGLALGAIGLLLIGRGIFLMG